MRVRAGKERVLRTCGGLAHGIAQRGGHVAENDARCDARHDRASASQVRRAHSSRPMGKTSSGLRAQKRCLKVKEYTTRVSVIDKAI